MAQLITVRPALTLSLPPSSLRNVSHVEQNQMCLPPPTPLSAPVLQQPLKADGDILGVLRWLFRTYCKNIAPPVGGKAASEALREQ